MNRPITFAVTIWYKDGSARLLHITVPPDHTDPVIEAAFRITVEHINAADRRAIDDVQHILLRRGK